MRPTRRERTMARFARWLINLPPQQKRLVACILDGICFTLAMALPVTLRFPDQAWSRLEQYVWFIAAAPVAGVAVFSWIGVYRQIVRFTDLTVIWRMLRGAVVATLVLTALSFFVRLDSTRAEGISRLVFVSFAIWALQFTGGWRLTARAFLRPSRRATSEPIIVFGAGAAGSAVIADIARDSNRRVLALVDDNPHMHGRELRGVRVWPSAELTTLMQQHNVSTVLLAAPTMPIARRREVVDTIARCGARVLTVPSLRELVEGAATVDQLREVSIEDLLGRDPVTPNQMLLTDTISGRAVLVTGAGGSIGGELCRQIVRLNPTLLVLLEQNEFALYEMEREIRQIIGTLEPDSRPQLRAYLGSVTDGVLMDAILRSHGVSTLYHAAACKHVPIVEVNEIEGVRTNSFGTLTAARAAAAAGVERFVLISTDKAVRPTSVMGASKRLAEMMLQALQVEHPRTHFVMVRFGNVLGSSGSVVPLFREQIRGGGPVTVTHPEMTRYFMTIPEAAELVLQAAAMGSGGEVFVLDMGEPVRITDLARRMISLAGHSVRERERPDGTIEIKYTGLRPGEKLAEELVISAGLEPTRHSGVLQARESYTPWETLEKKLVELEFCLDQRDSGALRRILRELMGEYTPQPEGVRGL